MYKLLKSTFVEKALENETFKYSLVQDIVSLKIYLKLELCVKVNI